MATYYVTAAAAGLGDGSLVNPWTLTQAIAAALTNADTVNVGAGTYTFAANQTIAGTARWVGVAGSTIVEWTGSSAHGLFRVPNYPGGGIFEGFTFKLHGSNAIMASNGNATYRDCIFDVQGFALPRVFFNANNIITERCIFTGNNVWSICNLPYYCESSLVRSLVTAGNAGLDIDGGPGVIRNATHSSGFARGLVVVHPGANAVVGSTNKRNHVIRDAILIGAHAFSIPTAVRVVAENVYYLASTAKQTGSGELVENNVVAIPESPFVDANALDLRLTTAAKAGANAAAFRRIMLGIVGTPGVTTDSLSELLGESGGSSGFTGIRGTTRTLGT